MKKIGDRVHARIEYGMEGGRLCPPETGRVVYVHPQRRYIVAEFVFPRGRFRQAFLTPDPARVIQADDRPVYLPGRKTGANLAGQKNSKRNQF